MSHNRTLLDALCASTVALEPRASATLEPGPHSGPHGLTGRLESPCGRHWCRPGLAPGRTERAATSHAKTAAHAREAPHQAQKAVEPQEVPRSFGRDITLSSTATRQPTLLKPAEGPLRLRDGRELRAPALTVGRSSRVRIHGVNEAGQSTLVDDLLKRWSGPPECLRVLPQELSI